MTIPDILKVLASSFWNISLFALCDLLVVP